MKASISNKNTNPKFYLLSTSQGVGGIETLIVRLACFLQRQGSEISILCNSLDSFVCKSLLRLKVNVFLLGVRSPASYMEKDEMLYIARKTRQVFDSSSESFLLTVDYYNLQITTLIEDKCLKILNGVFHPQAWPMQQYYQMKPRIRSIHKNEVYRYQRRFLLKLDCKRANWFMNDVTKKYHEYYYDVELPNSRIIPLPFDIPEIDPVGLKKARKKSNILKVVWLGRFEYFKNPSIKKTFEALQQLIEKHKGLKVEFDLIGYGSEKYEKDIRKEVKTSGRLQVKYLGKVLPDKLPEVIAQYDVGVAMGTSALHIGGMMIPSILVDASDEKHINQIKGCWLHEAPVGFLGEGVYADICGYTVEARRGLLTLFEELLELGTRSEIIGNKCYEYTLENYDENKIMPQIIDAWTSSTFSPGDMEVYRHPPLKRFIRRTAKKILRR